MPDQRFDEQRFDEDTQVKVVQLAARLQQQHRATASVAELAAIAEEAGVDPQFVEQALAVMASESQTVAAVYSPGATWKRTAWAVSLGSCAATFAFARSSVWVFGGGQAALLICLAALLSIGAASKRVTDAFAAGFCLTLLSGGFAWSLGAGTWFMQSMQEAVITLLFCAAGGAVAAITQFVWRYYRTRRN
jgi:hypothetical protein